MLPKIPFPQVHVFDSEVASALTLTSQRLTLVEHLSDTCSISFTYPLGHKDPCNPDPSAHSLPCNYVGGHSPLQTQPSPSSSQTCCIVARSDPLYSPLPEPLSARLPVVDDRT
ncbi:hypothetical protein GOP47_0022043 [Adiantum capillus-veneris]|uniref:Uncharacterized protein n=1 Tax=Adiantum capillus-veneris TaxID=13818 RepID=A0A9D4UAM5_ADICA|nr:hypothetical protein GOP47_0022043 [Adiantum capillus-veneris]